MGITLKQLTDTVSLIKDYVIHKTQKIDQINYAQKTVNSELEYFSVSKGSSSDITCPTNTNIPLSNFGIINTNMETIDDAYVSLKAGKRYNIRACVVTNTNHSIIIVLNDIETLKTAYMGTTYTTSSIDFIYEPTENCKISIRCNSGNIIMRPLFSYFTVQEVGREILIDPVEYINTTHGIEDTPVGHIIPHMGTTAPKHYLICDGTEYGIMDYPYLAQHIEDNFGSVNFFGGDGINTFAVPDLRGEFLRGSGTASRLTGSGAAVGVHQDPTWNHQLYKNGTANTLNFYGEGLSGVINKDAGYNVLTNNDETSTNGHKLTAEPYTSGATYPFYSSRPTNTSVLYCIKYEPTYYMKVDAHNTNYLMPTLYSEEERIIGAWVDGKPLYEKTIRAIIPEATSLGIGVQTSVSAGIENIDQMTKMDTQVSSLRFAFPIPWVEMNSNSKIFGVYAYYLNENSQFKITNSNPEYNNSNIYITVQYTKTTDAENSFTTNMIKDFIVNNGSNPNYDGEEGSGGIQKPSSGTVSWNCPSYTNEEVDAAIDEILNDDIIEEENIPAVIPELYPEMDDTPTVIPELYEEDTPTIIPEIPEETVEPEETPTDENIEE